MEKPSVFLTQEEKNLITNKVVETLTETTFGHHYYLWNGQVYRQKKGGAIGLRATGSLSRVAMDHWIHTFRSKLETLGIEVLLLRKYVDDVVIICKNLNKGDRVDLVIISDEESVEVDS